MDYIEMPGKNPNEGRQESFLCHHNQDNKDERDKPKGIGNENGLIKITKKLRIKK